MGSPSARSAGSERAWMARLCRFAERRLNEAYPNLVLDARSENVRIDGVIQTQAVFGGQDQLGRPGVRPRSGTVEPGITLKLDEPSGPRGPRVA